MWRLLLGSSLLLVGVQSHPAPAASTVSSSSDLVPNRHFSYHLAKHNDELVNACVAEAIETLQRETCLRFSEHSEPAGADVVFSHSSECAWQAANATVLLDADCLTAAVCAELVGRALAVAAPRAHLAPHVNRKFNCTEHCAIDCQNGATADLTSCTCQCTFGLEGKHCEKLERLADFTDPTCGEIHLNDTHTEGVLALSTHPDKKKAAVFCHWLLKTSDPWAVIALKIDDVDLDSDDIAEFARCNDELAIHGVAEEGFSNPVGCRPDWREQLREQLKHKDGEDNGDDDDNGPSVIELHSKPGQFSNASNIDSLGGSLLISLKSMPFARRPHSGPLLSYKLQRPLLIHAASEEMSSAASAASPFFTLVFATLGIMSSSSLVLLHRILH